MLLFFSTCLVLAQQFPGGFAAERAEIEYDRIRDETMARILLDSIRDERRELANPVSVRFYAGWDGEKPKDVKRVSVLLASQSTDWKFLKYRDAVVLAGGRRESLQSSHDGKAVSGGVREIIQINLPLSLANRMADSEDTAIALGSYSFAIPRDARQALRLFLDAIETPEKLPSLNSDIQAVYERGKAKLPAAGPGPAVLPSIDEQIVEAYAKALLARPRLTNRPALLTWRLNTFKRIAKEFGITHEEVSDAIKKLSPNLMNQ